MKNLFTILESEKQRILEMHINATKRNYLTEQASKTTTWTSGVLPANFDAGKYQIPTLKPQQKNNIDTKLEQLVNWIKNPRLIDKQINITIEASTSTSGTYDTNKKLTDQRYVSGKNYVDNYLKTNLPENIYKNITYKSKLEVEKGDGPDFQYFRIDANASAMTKGKEKPKGRKIFWTVEQPGLPNVQRIKYCPKRGSNWSIMGACSVPTRDAFYKNNAKTTVNGDEGPRWLPACDDNDEILKSPLVRTCLQYEGNYTLKNAKEFCEPILKKIPNFRVEFENLTALNDKDMSALERLNNVKTQWCTSIKSMSQDLIKQLKGQ